MKYDSILKEEKVYEDPVVHHSKYTKYIIIYLISLLIILGISYTIYYQNVLSPSNILFNEFNNIITEYQEIFMHILPDNLELNQKFEGTITFDENQYNYGLNRQNQNLRLEISNQEQYFSYQLQNQENYIELSSIPEKKIHLDDIYLTIPTIETLKRYFNNNKFIKRFYIEETNPIVEVNTVITKNDIKQLLGNNLEIDDYEITITLKNHAISNQLIDSKIVVNNKTKNIRDVYTYDSKEITYTDNNGKKYKFILKKNKEDFTLRIYQEDILYSIFIGKKLEKTYQYTYQIIDQVYNITLNIKEENNEYQYNLISNIEKNGVEQEQNLNLFLFNQKNNSLEESNNKIVEYQTLTKEEKNTYKEFISNFFLPFREFIKEYQNDVNNFQED